MGRTVRLRLRKFNRPLTGNLPPHQVRRPIAPSLEL
jgi:hypothetical protein